MKQDTDKINKIVKLYPIFYSLLADTIFFVPIDTLYFSNEIKYIKHCSSEYIVKCYYYNDVLYMLNETPKIYEENDITLKKVQ